MQKSDVIKRLKEYALLEKEMERINNKMVLINNKLLKIRTSKFNDVISFKDNYIIEKLLDEKSRLNYKLYYICLEKQFMDDTLNMLEKSDRKILVDFYCRKYTLSRIAREIMYSERQVIRKRDNALKKLEKLIY